MRHLPGVFDPEVVAAVHELRTYARAMGITIDDLSRRSGISDFAIRRWFGDRRMPEVMNLRILANALGYNIKISLEPRE